VCVGHTRERLQSLLVPPLHGWLRALQHSSFLGAILTQILQKLGGFNMFIASKEKKSKILVMELANAIKNYFPSSPKQKTMSNMGFLQKIK